MIALFLILGLSELKAGAAVATERHEFRSSEIKDAQVHNSTGDINIAPSEEKSSYVVINKIKWGPHCAAKVELEQGHLKVVTDDTAWVLDHECRVDLVISLPKKIPVQVTTGTGDVQILGSRGDIDVKVGSGLISLKGEIAKLTALSGSGDVKLEGSAKTASIKTGSGDIDLLYHEAPEKGQLQVQTGSGDVQVYLPESAKIKSQISTGNGLVVNEFAPATETERIDVNAESESGDIQIRKKLD